MIKKRIDSSFIFRRAGEFNRAELVEYAMIIITMPNSYLPKNHQLIDYQVPDKTIRYLSVTPKGRLTIDNGCYIDSIGLAEEFTRVLRKIFSRRKYSRVYKMKIEVIISPRTRFVTTKKRKDSEAIRKFLDKH